MQDDLFGVNFRVKFQGQVLPFAPSHRVNLQKDACRPSIMKTGCPMFPLSVAAVCDGGDSWPPFGLEHCGCLSLQATILQCPVTHLQTDPVDRVDKRRHGEPVAHASPLWHGSAGRPGVVASVHPAASQRLAASWGGMDQHNEWVRPPHLRGWEPLATLRPFRHLPGGFVGLLNSFLYGDSLTQILLEGHNPYALQKLNTADVDALRQQMFSSEKLRAYVSGRIVGSGNGVWAVTDQAVLLRNAQMVGAERLPLGEVTGFEAERGRFGHAVRLQTAGRRWSLYGVDRDLARSLHEAMLASGVVSQFDDRPAKSHRWQSAAPTGWALDCIEDARRRLSPA